MLEPIMIKIALCIVSVAIISVCVIQENQFERKIAERLLTLERGINFRDLGGYRTIGGGTVKWNRLFRSGHMASLTEADLNIVAGLNLKMILDFRTESEYGAEPDRLPGNHPPRVIHLPIRIGERSTVAEALKLAMGNSTLAEQKTHELMNRSIALDFLPEYRAMFEYLSDSENHPALVHCAAGRDRAGWAAALILLALDVPIETVFEDYLASNLFYGPLAEHWTDKPYAREWSEKMRTADMDPADIFKKLRVRKSFLQPAVDAANEKYGSIDMYLREGLGLSDDMRARLRSQLVLC